MSMGALLQAVTTKLRASLSLDADSCGPRFGGRPPAACGEEYVAVHSGAVRGLQKGSRSDEYGLQVTISRRTSYAPDDRAEADVVLKATVGMDARADAIIAAIHGGYDYVTGAGTGANALIGAAASGFVTALHFQHWTEQEVGPDWFGADSDGPCGVARTIVFGGARRDQSVESQT